MTNYERGQWSGGIWVFSLYVLSLYLQPLIVGDTEVDLQAELQHTTTQNAELKLENNELKDELYELNELIVTQYIGQHDIDYSDYSEFSEFSTDDIGLTIQAIRTTEGEYNYD